MKWFTVAGLAFDLAGALVIAVGVIATRTEIGRVTQAISGHNPAAREDRRKQSNFALAGLLLLVVGFVLQIVVSWPR